VNRNVGIMQGRLSAPPRDRIQAFPWSSWEGEFNHARDCGFSSIEWLFEAENYEQNPVWTESGRELVRNASSVSQVPVRSLCADYFMEHPFFRVPAYEAARSVTVLETLVDAAAALGISTILIPVLEKAEVRTHTEEGELLRCLEHPLDLAAERGVRLALETELPAARYGEMVERADHPALGVYYDTGNAAAKGFDAARDLRALAPLLAGVHLKDRTPGGPTVPLGTGSVNFDEVFAVLRNSGFSGPMIIQSTSGDDYVGCARAHLEFVNARIAGGEL
jgi:L-ribulose-5-phosphate 3-epimerase